MSNPFTQPLLPATSLRALPVKSLPISPAPVKESTLILVKVYKGSCLLIRASRNFPALKIDACHPSSLLWPGFSEKRRVLMTSS